MDILTITLRFAITFAMSFVSGVERQRSHKPAGLGTFIFIAIGTCGLAIAALMLGESGQIPLATGNLLGGIVTGVGFLGAGALIRTNDKIFGFTTATSIWVFAILGFAIGIGQYILGVIMYALVWTVIFVDKFLERKGIGPYQKKLVVMTNRLVAESELSSTVGLKSRVISAEIDRKNNRMTATYLVQGTKEEIKNIPNVLMGKDWFDYSKIE